jgi:DNA repair protein RecO (recombination protein O)
VITKTDAVVLKWKPFGETSKIVTLLSEDYGRLAVIAKGARTGGKRYGPELDSLNHVQVVLYMKEGRDLHLLSQCSLLRRFGMLTTDLQRLGSALSILELASAVSYHGGECRDLFRTLLGALEAMNQRSANQLAIVLYFQTKLLEVLGFKPNLHSCRSCGNPLSNRNGTKQREFRLTPHGVQCDRCGDGRIVGGISLDLLVQLQEFQDAMEAGNMNLEEHAGHEISRIIWFLLESHIDDLRKLKSESVFSTL